nr:MAG TPA: hypothetical protein [Caudoviricetes sp.]
MGRYNVRQKQSLDGIATLTNDPLAVENIQKNVIRKDKKKA